MSCISFCFIGSCKEFHGVFTIFFIVHSHWSIFNYIVVIFCFSSCKCCIICDLTDKSIFIDQVFFFHHRGFCYINIHAKKLKRFLVIIFVKCIDTTIDKIRTFHQHCSSISFSVFELNFSFFIRNLFQLVAFQEILKHIVKAIIDTIRVERLS